MKRLSAGQLQGLALTVAAVVCAAVILVLSSRERVSPGTDAAPDASVEAYAAVTAGGVPTPDPDAPTREKIVSAVRAAGYIADETDVDAHEYALSGDPKLTGAALRLSEQDGTVYALTLRVPVQEAGPPPSGAIARALRARESQLASVESLLTLLIQSAAGETPFAAHTVADWLDAAKAALETGADARLVTQRAVFTAQLEGGYTLLCSLVLLPGQPTK